MLRARLPPHPKHTAHVHERATQGCCLRVLAGDLAQHDVPMNGVPLEDKEEDRLLAPPRHPVGGRVGVVPAGHIRHTDTLMSTPTPPTPASAISTCMQMLVTPLFTCTTCPDADMCINNAQTPTAEF